MARSGNTDKENILPAYRHLEETKKGGMMADNNSKWKLAFWIITFVCGVGIAGNLAYSNSNDKGSQQRDQDIRKEMLVVERKFNDKVDKIVETQTTKFEEQSEKLFDIKELILAVKFHIENGN